MWDYYNDKTIFITGGTGFLGTAIVYRLLTQTSVRHVYMLCRGGIGKLQSKWTQSLSSATVEKLLGTNRITVMDGDILSPDLGISQKDLSILRQEVNVIIHSASSINLAKSLDKLSEVITGASERVAGLALTCPGLNRFVYVSTVYSNSYLPPTGEGIQVKIKEEIYDPNPNDHPDVMKEWAQVQQTGSSDAYEAHDFPWSYAYAKNLTERLLIHMFAQSGFKDKLLIVRPSVIGPAQNFPVPGYTVPLSSPTTLLAAMVALIPGGVVTIATKAVGQVSQLFIDEVPVDVVVDRLLAHLAMATTGCVHAVSGKRAQPQFIKWWDSAVSLRRLPRNIDLNWKDLDWKSKEQHRLARFYVILGAYFEFYEDKTIALGQNPLVESCKELQLFNKLNYGEQLQSRTEDIYFVMNHVAESDERARRVIKQFYRGSMKAKI
ncbi:Male sterility, NAD-binding [Penicillium italicum]|uniref:Fatty acyl-CoA reductase n=1 Tax=Penicillium italicum TaxID=40296 RepID=A0A0A2LB48_PENIT|nr:Male sterility, NAD-binding [Penicillium italicum]